MRVGAHGIRSISYLMAAHDAGAWIEAALTSALAQEDVAVEVVVVDDASRDDTAARVAAFAIRDPRVTLLRRSVSGGPAAARNLALAHAAGTWVGILDADDLIEPDRSRLLIDFAEQSGCAVVADNLLRFLDADPQTAWPMLPLGPSFRVAVAAYLRRNLLTGGDTNLGYLKPIFRRTFLSDRGIRYDERLRIGEDFDLCLRCLAAGTDLAVLPAPLYRYRMVAGSLSRRLTRTDVDAMLASQDAALGSVTMTTSIRSAVAAYRRSLLDGLAYLEFRSALRGRDWRRTAREASRLRLWRAIAQIGFGLIARRLARRRPAVSGPPATVR